MYYISKLPTNFQVECQLSRTTGGAFKYPGYWGTYRSNCILKCRDSNMSMNLPSNFSFLAWEKSSSNIRGIGMLNIVIAVNGVSSWWYFIFSWSSNVSVNPETKFQLSIPTEDEYSISGGHYVFVWAKICIKIEDIPLTP